MGGNPCFTYADTVNGGNNDRTKFYFDSTSVIKLLVGQGFNGLGSYSFKSLRTASEESSYWLKTNNRYLSYADKITIDGHDYGYHNDGITIQTKGDIIFKNDLDEYSSWNLDFDSDGFVYMTRYNEPNRYGQEGITNPISMQWNNSYTQGGYFGYYFGSSSLRILRKIDITDPTQFEFYIPKKGTKTHYEPDETAVLDGLEMDVLYKLDYTHIPVTYENESSFFTPGRASYASQELSFEWCGIETSYSVTVDVEKTDEHYYYSMHGFNEINDLRGTYLLGVNDDSVTKVLNLSDIPTDSSDAKAPAATSLSDEFETICDKNDLNQYLTDITNNVFEIVYDTDGYYVKVGSSYLCRENRSTYYLLYLGTRENSFQVRLGLNGTLRTPDNDIFIYCHSYGSTGVYLNKYGNVNSNEDEMVLYKKELSSENSTEMNTFCASFFSHTSVCTNDDTTVLENLGWSTLASEFNDLSVDSQGYIACLTYVHNGEASESLNDMVDRYDYIVNKYGMNNFMNRNSDLMNNLQGNTNPANMQNTIVNHNAIIVVVAVSMIVLTSITAIFLFKKRKHNI